MSSEHLTPILWLIIKSSWYYSKKYFHMQKMSLVGCFVLLFSSILLWTVRFSDGVWSFILLCSVFLMQEHVLITLYEHIQLIALLIIWTYFYKVSAFLDDTVIPFMIVLWWRSLALSVNKCTHAVRREGMWLVLAIWEKHVLHSQIELEYPVRNITDQKDKV